MSSEGYQKGDIIKIRGKVIHWAVCIGGDDIVHYQKKDGIKKAIIQETLQEYMRREEVKSNKIKKGKMFWIKPFTPDEVVQRALSKVGEDAYNLAMSNCEHFAKWCKYGQFSSTQAEAVGSAAGVGGGAGVGAGIGAFIGGVAGFVVGGPIGAAIGIPLGGGIGAGAGGTVAVAAAGGSIAIHRFRPH